MNAVSPEDEAAIEATKAPLMEHLVELRKRLIWAFVSFGGAFVVCWYFAGKIYAFLQVPLSRALASNPNAHMIATAPQETFFTYMKVGAFAGLCLAFPLIAAQLWMFVAPGLYKHERRAFLPFLLATPFMFLLGASFVYYIMLPFALKFFASYRQRAATGRSASSCKPASASISTSS